MNIHSKRFKQIIRLAKVQRTLSDVKDYKLSAVIFDNRRVYASGYNTDKTIPMQGEYNRYKQPHSHSWKHSAHAEMNCLHKLLQQYYNKLPKMDKLSILVYRENAHGDFAMARPCPACEAALKKLGIKNIYYTGRGSLVHEEYCLSDLRRPYEE